MDDRLTWDECAPVVRQMARKYRGYRALAFDRDDLFQEASIVAMKCIETFDVDRVVSDRRAFLRTAIRNHFIKTRDRAYAERRVQKDVRGGVMHPVSYEVLSARRDEDLPRWFRCLELPAERSHEEQVVARELVGKLYERLPREQWDVLVEAFVEGAYEVRAVRRGKPRQIARLRLDLVKQRATVILSQICYPVEKETGHMQDFIQSLYAAVDPAENPVCLPGGAEEQGYDLDDPLCQRCPDKFRCLPTALAQGLIEGELSQDVEVEDVIQADGFEAKARAHERAVERMLRRVEIIKEANLKGEVPIIPVELLTRRPKPVAVDSVGEEIEPVPMDPLPLAETVSADRQAAVYKVAADKLAGSLDHRASVETNAAKLDDIAEETTKVTRKRKRPVKKKKTATKKRSAKAGRKTAKARKAAAKKSPKKKAKRAVSVKHSNGRARMKNGKPLPVARQLTESQMQKALSRIRIGQPFDLELGMQLVRMKRGGDVIVVLQKNGFECDGVVYSSLSTAIMHQELRIVSGNAWFNLDQNKCTEIRDKNGKPIAGHEMRYKP